MKSNNTSDHRPLIEQLAANTTELLNQYWKQAETLALGTDELKLGVVHSIKLAPQGGWTVKSTMSFGRRIKAAVEHIVDPGQLEMPLEKPSRAKRG